MAKRKYVQIGTGGRSDMFRKAICETYPKNNELLAVCDINEGRVKITLEELKEKYNTTDVVGYDAKDFDKMLAEQKPDCVIVTTKDCFHDEYICRAMEAGCDVMTEKPMTIDAKKCQKIIDTQRKTGQECVVTFNYRYSPPRTQIKDMIMNGDIGEVLSIDFHWMLDTTHGADYYRRWHRNKTNSGGLMVHKSTHHFDLVNWWLSSIPTKVYASGGRRFYVPKTADRYGLTNRASRCHECPEIKKCPFALDMADNENLKRLYLDNEKYDGYFRDKCVFGDDIDIEDTMNVLIDYANGTRMSYSLNSFMPWEGFYVVFNGTKGRIEHKCQEQVYINADGTVPGVLDTEATWTKLFLHWQPPKGIELWTGEGGHGGADPVMLSYLFDEKNQPIDKYKRKSDQRAGAYSILSGIAANISMAENRPVNVEELVSNIGLPDYPEMPTASEKLDTKPDVEYERAKPHEKKEEKD